MTDRDGRYAFLYYTALLLFFFPRNRLLVQLRVTLYGIVGSALGLAWGIATLAVAAYCGRRYGADSDESRAVIGMGLALLALMCESFLAVSLQTLKVELTDQAGSRKATSHNLSPRLISPCSFRFSC